MSNYNANSDSFLKPIRWIKDACAWEREKKLQLVWTLLTWEWPLSFFFVHNIPTSLRALGLQRTLHAVTCFHLYRKVYTQWALTKYGHHWMMQSHAHKHPKYLLPPKQDKNIIVDDKKETEWDIAHWIILWKGGPLYTFIEFLKTKHFFYLSINKIIHYVIYKRETLLDDQVISGNIDYVWQSRLERTCLLSVRERLIILLWIISWLDYYSCRLIDCTWGWG